MKTDERLSIEGVVETCLYVDDLSRAERFYSDVLGLTMESRQPGRHVFFYCGRGMLLLFDAAASSSDQSQLPAHGARGAGHAALAIDPRLTDAWAERLQHCGVAIEQRVRWPSGHESLYFRDPAGNSLELTSPSIWGIDEGSSGAR